LFKKVVIADNCAYYANEIFGSYTHYNGSTLLFGLICFSFQIYCDFSGYSDIAIGTARLLGFRLMRNFAYPYFSRDIAEFWRRWHISLSTWFRDYVYIPLGGSRGSKANKVRNTLVIFVVSGFWHGANWTFIAWGLLNAIYFMPLLLLKRNRKNLDIVAKGHLLPSMNEILHMAGTFGITLLAWVFFRSATIGDAFSFIRLMFTQHLFSYPQLGSIRLVFFILILLVTEWLNRNYELACPPALLKYHRVLRLGFYYAIIILIGLYGGNQQEFIYFQF
jgi:D-alanyl-lipoteichoic acid acyltransferase DltB (MBOAT superfamily)